MSHLRSLLSYLVFAGTFSVAAAAPIQPVSYSYNGINPSLYVDSGNELTDGALQTIGPGFLGFDNWVGFDRQDASITFNFNEVVTIGSVTLSSVRWGQAAVYLPETVQIGGTSFSVNEELWPEFTKVALTFSGNWTGTSLTIDLTRAGQWTFLDEVTFASPSSTAPSVPDQGATAALLGLALTGIAAGRRFGHRPWVAAQGAVACSSIVK